MPVDVAAVVVVDVDVVDRVCGRGCICGWLWLWCWLPVGVALDVDVAV